MKKEIIFGLAGLAGGVAIGVGATLLVQKITKPKEKKMPLLTRDLPKEETPEPTQEDEEVERIEVTPEEMARFKEIIAQEGYGVVEEEDEDEEEEDPAESEFPEDDDPDDISYKTQVKLNAELEQYRKEHEGVIELMTEDQWTYESDFPEDDYGREELFFFRNEGELTDEDGNLLEPIEKYVGELFSKTRFWTNDWQVLYIRNHPMQTDYKVSKPMIEECDDRGIAVYRPVSREEFFY